MSFFPLSARDIDVNWVYFFSTQSLSKYKAMGSLSRTKWVTVVESQMPAVGVVKENRQQVWITFKG